jgi:8-oxo-dGTP diphosphatase
MLLVTAAVIEKDGLFLLTQRPLEKHNGGRWEFPGGKVEEGEDPRQCLRREIAEELGIAIEVGEVFELSSHVYSGGKHVILLAFRCRYIGGEIQKKEITDFVWVSPDEMETMDITEADLPFLERL